LIERPYAEVACCKVCHTHVERAGQRRASCARERSSSACPRARTRVLKSGVGEVLPPPRLEKAFARSSTESRCLATLPWSYDVTAWKGIGKACRKVQPWMFKRGMLLFDSLLWARSFRALVPRTPRGFSLPAEAFLGCSVVLTPRWPAPSRSGLPSSLLLLLEEPEEAGAWWRAAPLRPSRSHPRVCRPGGSRRVEPPSLSWEGRIFYRLKLAGRFLSCLLCCFCSHVCCNMQGEAPNCQAL